MKLCNMYSLQEKYNSFIHSYIHYRSLTSPYSMGGQPGEEPVTWEKRNKGWRMNCDVGEATEGFESEL